MLREPVGPHVLSPQYWDAPQPGCVAPLGLDGQARVTGFLDRGSLTAGVWQVCPGAICLLLLLQNQHSLSLYISIWNRQRKPPHLRFRWICLMTPLAIMRWSNGWIFANVMHYSSGFSFLGFFSFQRPKKKKKKILSNSVEFVTKTGRKKFMWTTPKIGTFWIFLSQGYLSTEEGGCSEQQPHPLPNQILLAVLRLPFRVAGTLDPGMEISRLPSVPSHLTGKTKSTQVFSSTLLS